VLDDAGKRAVKSLLLANGRLYAGLQNYGSEQKKQGILWSCDPRAVNACKDLDSYGKTYAGSLAAGGGYRWAGLDNGILWRCDLNAKDACLDWDTAGGPITSVSYSPEGHGTLYAAVGGDHGVIWTCSTTARDSCTNIFGKDNKDKDINVDGKSVAAGAGSVFSSTADGLYFGTSKYSGATSNLNGAKLIYVPAGGPVGVGGVEVHVSARKLGAKLAERCKAGKNPKAIILAEGPKGMSKTVKAGACALARGGTVKQAFDLLDAGVYTVTVTAGKRTGQASFTITQDTTRKLNLKLKRARNGG